MAVQKGTGTRRTWSVAMLMILMLAFTAACGGKPATPAQAPATATPAAATPAADSKPAPPKQSEKITFRILTPIWRGEPGNKAFDDLLGQFKKQNPDLNIDFDVEYLPNYDRLNEKLTTYAAGNMLPDLFMLGAGWVEAFAGKGLLTPLDGRITPDVLADYEPTILDAGYYKGKLYGLPLVLDTRVLVYRKDMFQAAGLDPEKPPTTLAELMEAAKKLTKRDAQGKIQVAGFDPITHKNRQTFYQLYWAAGARLFNADNSKALFNSPEGLKAFEFWHDVFRGARVNEVGFTTGIPGRSGASNVYLMVMDKAAIGLYHQMMWNEIEERRPDLKDKLGVFVLQDTAPAVFFGGTLGVISANSKHQEVAWRVLKFVASKEAVTENVRVENTLPPLKSLADIPAVKNNLLARKGMEYMKYARREGGPDVWLQIRPKIDAALEEIANGKRPVKEIVDDLTKQTNDLIAQGKTQ